MNSNEKIEYLKRSYAAVDGLWFMKAEEAFGFEKALELDNQVWSVMPKIQARFLQTALGVSEGLPALKACFTEKLLLDGAEFTVEDIPDGFSIRMTKCHWHEAMIKSGREHLSPTIGLSICPAECSGWAKEFGDDISFDFQSRICTGSNECIFTFQQYQ